MAGLQARAQRAKRVVKARLDRATRNADPSGDVVDRPALPIAHDDDDAVVEIEGGERPIQIGIVVADRRRGRPGVERHRRWRQRYSTLPTSKLVTALVH